MPPAPCGRCRTRCGRSTAANRRNFFTPPPTPEPPVSVKPNVGCAGFGLSNSQTGKFESVPPSTMYERRGGIGCAVRADDEVELDRLEEVRDRHAHPCRLGDREGRRVDRLRRPRQAIARQVLGQHEQPPVRDVGRDQLQARRAPVAVVARDRERAPLEHAVEPLLERVPGRHAVLEHESRDAAEVLAPEREVLERDEPLGIEQRDHVLADRGLAVEREVRGDDRSRARARDALPHRDRRGRVLREPDQRAGECKPFDAPAAKDAVGLASPFDGGHAPSILRRRAADKATEAPSGHHSG